MTQMSEYGRVALVVEDEPLILMEAVDILEGDGFQVMEAWNADMALRILEETGPVSLLFTDVHMPGTRDGFALARDVKARWPETHVVVCSGHVMPGPDTLPQGAVFINKPFSSKLVLDTVAAITGR